MDSAPGQPHSPTPRAGIPRSGGAAAGGEGGCGGTGGGGGAGGCGGGGGRLNLLLSYAGWNPDSWADRLPVLLEPMGVRTLRVFTGRQASEVIRVNAIHIAVVDLGLPLDECRGRTAPAAPEETSFRPGPVAEEAGPRLLDLLSRLDQPPPILVIKRSLSHRDDSREIAAALKANAFSVLDRPRNTHDVELLLDTLRRCLLRHYQGRWPGLS